MGACVAVSIHNGLGSPVLLRPCHSGRQHRVYSSLSQESGGEKDIRGVRGELRRGGAEQLGSVRPNATDDMLLSRMDGSSILPNTRHGISDAMHSHQLQLPRQDSTSVSSKKVMSAPKTEVTSQHFGGALTTLVFGAALLSERLNGVGIVQNLELHNKGFHPVLLSSIAMLLVASAWPEKREWKNPTLLVRIQMAGARFAYLGLAGSIAAEMVTGRGVLSLLDVETGVEAFSDVEAVLIFLTMLVLTGPQSREIR